MARNNLVPILGLGVLTVVAGSYGLLGPQVQGILGGLTKSVTGGAAPVSTQPPFSGKSSQLLAQIGNNPNFVSQATTWRSERRQNGEDPNSWTAFVAHEIAIGAPDPGSPPPEWPAAFGGTFGQ